MQKRVRNIIFNDRFSSHFGALFFTFWIGQRLYFNHIEHFALSVDALSWWLITFQFCIFVGAYLTRHDAKVCLDFRQRLKCKLLSYTHLSLASDS